MAYLRKKEDRDKIKRTMIERYPSLTENDFKTENPHKLMVILETKLGKTHKELRNIINKI